MKTVFELADGTKMTVDERVERREKHFDISFNGHVVGSISGDENSTVDDVMGYLSNFSKNEGHGDILKKADKK